MPGAAAEPAGSFPPDGRSSGEPRHTTSPGLFAEDFGAGADVLGTLPDVDRESIDVIGICGKRAFALRGAQADPRIRAVATSAMYDISRATRNGWQDSTSDDDLAPVAVAG